MRLHRERRERAELKRRSERTRAIVAAHGELGEWSDRRQLLGLALVRTVDLTRHRACEQQAQAEEQAETAHAVAYSMRAG